MVVKIRFARFGPRHSPFYNIVVAQARYVIFLNLPGTIQSAGLRNDHGKD